MAALEIVDTRLTDRRTKDAVRHLFDEDGTIYLVTGFFTRNAYDALRDDIASFLNRSPDNELVLVIGAGADQFAPSIARDLWQLDTAGQVRIYKYPDGFLHAKLYVRVGHSPAVILSSANLTRVALEQNLEVGAVIRGDDCDDPQIRPFLEWLDNLVAVCEPLRRRDLLAPLRFVTTVRNWANKGRLLPLRHAVRRASLRLTPFLVIIATVVYGLQGGL